MIDRQKMVQSTALAMRKIKGFMQKTRELAKAEVKARIAPSLKKAEDALRENEAKYRTLLENLPQRVFLKNKDSVYMSCNENYARDLDVRPDEIVGKTDYDFFPRKLAERFRADDKNIMESGQIEDIEQSYIQSGKERFVHTIKTPIKEGNGNIVGVLGISWDITERKEMERHLIDAEKLATVGRLAAGIAHEINNPLASILLNAQMLAHTIKKEGRAAANTKAHVNTLEKVERAVHRCKRIVAGLLAFSRPSNLQLEPTNTNKVIEETLEDLEKQIKTRNVMVIKHFEKNLPIIMADGQQLGEVFSNLIMNACEAMPKGGQLRILTGFQTPDTRTSGEAMRAAGEIIKIEFSDTGKGIPEEALSRIFDPFFTTKGRGKGVGLGLSISYGIIKEHGGVIEASSQEGKGAAFIIRIPAKGLDSL